ncbi:RNA 2',3'-cyclic phosphodiesterase [Exiguobacterium marinum]|uniref:RNA 2',3'-cyclic phosphodiesterase n=1 Tax=Exiguobacterium marinum TaxID=273528 RepID=A0ABY7WWR9_9BACL|nr:RNA 2',3'-cyclic phosphodiesterase [Exiguobacterium marinum]WDH75020.1 RNA 2',3'-cyclic phosphodiesterase [Exiguobacterium marinum]
MSRHYFIAIPIEATELIHVQHAILPYYSYRRIYRPDEFHMTIQFLGYVDGEELDEVKEITRRICEDTLPFTLTFRSIDHFGRPDRPRVLTIVPDDSEPLQRLAHALRQELVDVIPRLDRKAFVPHVTLAKKWDAGERVPYVSPEFQVTESVEEVILYEVQPNHTPAYRAVEVFPLRRPEEDIWQSRLKFLT